MMEKENTEETISKFPARGYELLSWAARGRDLTVRDDQYHFPWLMDIVKFCQKKRGRFRLIDSGKLETSELELLGKEGADLYTSDDVRPNAAGLELINKACKKGKAIVAYFHHGPLEKEEKGEDLERVPFLDLERLARSGVYLHLTNKEKVRNFSHLNFLADSCRRGQSWLVYYHQGPLEQSLGELDGAWVHISDESLKEPQDLALLMEILKVSSSKRTNFVLHLKGEWKAHQLRDVLRTGAVILFKSALTDYRSPLKPLEREAGRRKLDFKVYYLYPHFLP